MKLTRGEGSPETGGCWMALNDYYARGVLDWTDQPECVDPVIRPLCIGLNDWCEDGEREELIGPHVWTTMGTYSDELRGERLKKIVQAAVDFGCSALTLMGRSDSPLWRTDAIRSHLEVCRDDRQSDYSRSASAVVVISHGFDSGKQFLLNLILDLCAMSTPKEVVPAVSKEEALRVVCGVGCE